MFQFNLNRRNGWTLISSKYWKIDQNENTFQDYATFNFFISFFPDWEATNEAIEEQVARESYFQWLRDNERRQVNSFKN